MPKPIEKWFLYQYIGLQLTPLSKPFKKKEEAEKARDKYPENARKKIGLGVVRLGSYEIPQKRLPYVAAGSQL